MAVKAVAVIVPVPEVAKEPPVPTTKAAVLVEAVTPEKGVLVAAIVPVPVASSEPPVPICKALALVPVVIDVKVGVPPLLSAAQAQAVPFHFRISAVLTVQPPSKRKPSAPTSRPELDDVVAVVLVVVTSSPSEIATLLPAAAPPVKPVPVATEAT